MKKAVVLFAAMAIGTGSFAQKSKIYSATEYLKDDDMKKAVAAINEAVANESTKTDGDAWFVRGQVYEKLGTTDPTATDESIRSYIQVLEVKPTYDRSKIDPKLSRIGTMAYNKGVEAYGQTNYDAAITSFQRVQDIRNINEGKHFAGEKKFDTVAGLSIRYQALSAVYGNKDGSKDDEAINFLTKAKNNAVARDPNIFSQLIDLQTKKGNLPAVETLITEAKALFPKDVEVGRQEMNYYLRAGKTDVLIQKMEDAAKTDPDNALLQYNLATLYSNLANPVDEKSGKRLDKPANSKELEAKAETAFKMAIDNDPTKADYQYNLGALYFNNAMDIVTKMQSVSGHSDADNKKYDALKTLRNNELTKSLPFFQKAYDMLDAKMAKDKTLDAADNDTYQSSLRALENIYDSLGQAEKKAEITKKLDALK